MSHYRKGADAERKSVLYHKTRGARLVLRAAGSKSLADVVVFDAAQRVVWVIQCKTGRKARPSELAPLRDLARDLGGPGWHVMVNLEDWKGERCTIEPMIDSGEPAPLCCQSCGKVLDSEIAKDFAATVRRMKKNQRKFSSS